jgi:triosephosphate isomerase
MSRDKKLIVGNWKMNLNTHEASLYLHKLSSLVKVRRDVDVVLAPTLLALQSLSLQVDRRQFKLAVQNLYWRDQGAFTGEVSANQLRGVADYAIIGHSERRHIFHESDKDIRNKVQASIRNHIAPILCIGETAAERAAGETKDVLHDQLIGGLTNVTSEELEKVTIAYEPVWAIGTGDNALPRDVERAVASIQTQIQHLYGAKAAKAIAILYGGSVTTENAADYLAVDGIDGLLVGGASLDARTFSSIADKAHKGSGVTKK